MMFFHKNRFGDKQRDAAGLTTRDVPPAAALAALLAGIFLVFFTPDIHAQQVRAYLSADSVRVGDRFELTVVASHTTPEDPIFPGIEAGEEVFGDLEVLRVLGAGTLSDAAAARTDSLVYEVTTFALDTAFVPSIPVFFVAGGDTSFAAAFPIVLPVVSLVPEDAAGIRDLAPIAEFPINAWAWVLAFLILAAVLGALYYFWQKRKDEPAPVELVRPEPRISPLEEAIQRLRSLEKNANLTEVSKIKPFYVELTEILRVYLSRRLRINAMESTSDELIWDLKKLARGRRVTPEMVQLTHRVLNVADLVKFADMHPAPEVGHQAFRETRKVIDEVENLLQQMQAAATASERSTAERPVPEAPAADPRQPATAPESGSLVNESGSN